MAKLIAQTYGQALYELAVEENKAAELLEEVKGLKTAFVSDGEFSRFMKLPQITKEQKQEVIENALKGKISDDLMGLLVIMVEKDRFSEVVSVFDYFIDAVMKLMGIGTAKVVTPLPLDEIRKSEIMEKLLATTGYKEIEVTYEVDSSLIGGMVIRIGDRVVDSSVKTRIDNLKKDLLQVQLQN